MQLGSLWKHSMNPKSLGIIDCVLRQWQLYEWLHSEFFSSTLEVYTILLLPTHSIGWKEWRLNTFDTSTTTVTSRPEPISPRRPLTFACKQSI
jgi:hypothetical protein